MQCLELRGRFDRVTDRVAEVQDFAEPGLALIACDNRGFDLHAARDDVGQLRQPLLPRERPVFHERAGALEVTRIRDDAVLDDLRESRAKMFGRKGP